MKLGDLIKLAPEMFMIDGSIIQDAARCAAKPGDVLAFVINTSPWGDDDSFIKIRYINSDHAGETKVEFGDHFEVISESR